MRHRRSADDTVPFHGVPVAGVRGATAALLLLAACAGTRDTAPPSRYDLAREAAARGDRATADAEVKLALQEDPLDARSHFLLGCLLAERGEPDQAAVGFHRAASLDPARGDAAHNLGTLLLARGEPVPAARWLELAATLRPADPRPCVNLARAYFRSELPELAAAAYDEALRRDPASRAALQGLVRLCEGAGLRPEAADYRMRLEALGGPPLADAAYAGGSGAAAAPSPRDGDGGARAAGPSSAAAPRPSGAPGEADAEALRAILRDLPHVTVERRGDRIAVCGWTEDAREKEILAQALAGRPDVVDLTGDDASDAKRMIEVDATLFIVRELTSESVGFNFLRLVNLNLSYFASENPNQVTRSITGAGATRTSVSSAEGWVFSAGVDYDVNIANAVDERVAVLARPHLTALSGTPAKFLAGGELVFRVSGNVSGDIKPYPFGTTLTVTPTLLRSTGEDGAPRVHLVVEAGRTSVLELLTGASSDDVVSFDKLTVTSEAVMPVGRTLVLSGLSQRESRSGESGVPILSSIPVLKWFFSSKTTIQSDSAVIILLTPRDPAFLGERNRKDLAEFVEQRRAYIEARRGSPEDMARFRERYPEWDRMPPNRFASHFFLMRTSELYRGVSSEDLPVDGLVLDLLGE